MIAILCLWYYDWNIAVVVHYAVAMLWWYNYLTWLSRNGTIIYHILAIIRPFLPGSI